MVKKVENDGEIFLGINKDNYYLYKSKNCFYTMFLAILEKEIFKCNEKINYFIILKHKTNNEEVKLNCEIKQNKYELLRNLFSKTKERIIEKIKNNKIRG